MAKDLRKIKMSLVILFVQTEITLELLKRKKKKNKSKDEHPPPCAMGHLLCNLAADRPNAHRSLIAQARAQNLLNMSHMKLEGNFLRCELS